jgi:nonribosomal peptide synthetase DhbF
VPTGVAGELYIAGVGLARGYLGRPGPTSERFVANPYEVGERMYRTGDLVRWRPDGSLDFLGRVDRQLKIRGFRIEPGEVEAVLSGHPGVSQVAVASRGGDDDARLVAYVVPTTQPDGQPDIRELRSKCERQLPAFMVPSAFTVLPELPLTPSGKIDFGSLGTAEPAVPNSERRRPLLPREELMCGLFMEVLGVDAIGLDDDFFELGGHSLLATRLVSRVRAELGVQLSMRGLFRFSTVTSLLAGIESGECLETAARPALRRRVASD